MTSRRPFLLLRISFPERPIFIQFVPAVAVALVPGGGHEDALDDAAAVGLGEVSDLLALGTHLKS